MLLATSCATKTEVVYDVPEIDFPDFPECDRWEALDVENIKISSDWFVALAKFKTRYEGKRKEYYALETRISN